MSGKNFDVVDDAWLEDYLSDDEIDLLEDDEVLGDDLDATEFDSSTVLEASVAEEDRWNDLGLEHIVQGGGQ
eukprot:CAMPEP_0197302284 /NCGR_PEP_ID=MMETSP0890-20130614/50949_1 /TAXON_ID=44058 ORGANISM="Aureoumbra lagunensis, Strain CCMP1510" /NCGR_SAMPLE_ID=MMETSP0890 /ASSEMBLY_ACC=CAM_ASM_000533 /LENGTH=71 /DNA_ID=CAMNT_0042781839 /DNA_START=152 /DNA_END=367 /DNA_ORIENTATION=+